MRLTDRTRYTLRKNRRKDVVALFRFFTSCVNHVVMSATFIAFVWDSCYTVRKPIFGCPEFDCLPFQPIRTREVQA